jgi:hypothetical protein
LKKTVFLSIFFVLALGLYGQRLSTVGILPFTVSGEGVSEADAGTATSLVIQELRSWETLSILSGAEAEDAEYLVKGQISRQNNMIVLSAVTSEKRSGRNLNTSREQGAGLNAVSMDSFCAQISENVPFPNYLLGKWQSTVNMVDGPVICVMEFLPNRTVSVQRFDTWEHSGANSLKYQGIGTGSYSYAGYSRRTVTLGGRQIRTDATVSINLTLEDALPRYEKVNAGGLRLLFGENRASFELVYGAIPCGENLSGPQVYPSQNVYYTRFSKL